MPPLAGLANVKVKQLLWPAIWLLLVILFLTNAFHSPTFQKGVNKLSGSGINSSSISSIKDSLSDKVADYFGDSAQAANATTLAFPDIVTANISTSKKVAVIIETRQSSALIPLILHFSSVLGPDWPVVIYTSAENFGTFSASHALLRYQKTGRIVVRPLASGVYFPSWDSVSRFLTRKTLWEDLAPAEHVLIFQNDAILCANSVRSVEDFFEWDLIGAPIDGRYGRGYNGGLSLRKRSTTLRALEKFDWERATGMRAEDQWYYNRFLDLQRMDQEEGIEDGIKLPSMELARTFAVETIDYPSPLGLHQPTRFIHKHMLELDDYCPEYKLARTTRNF